ncbi:MAG: AmmeMemoRadiSam system radical SAM enzyme [Planctomycetota bacterium]|jgi:pyruvate formate lyase activating enzyme
MQEAWLYDKLDRRRVRCNVCSLRCTIQEGERGVCGTRWNNGGTLYTLLYGLTSSVAADPIEKKPMYHLYPGSIALSLGAVGCNFHCPGCQNWHISHDQPGKLGENMQKLGPADTVRLAKKLGCHGITWTYNEPVIWLEQTLPAMKEAKDEGLYTGYVTNGYATRESMELIGPYLTAWRTDVKGMSRKTYKKIAGISKFEPVLEMATLAKRKYGMHVECVTNVTPTVNDSDSELRDLARWIAKDLGDDTPWHVTRFHPHQGLADLPPTPLKTLERAYDIGKEEGLKYVYMGNVPGHPGEDTYCHACGELIIRRSIFAITKAWVKDGKCARCGAEIPGRFPEGEIGPSGGRLRPFL